jgi:hypothetical protein
MSRPDTEAFYRFKALFVPTGWNSVKYLKVWVGDTTIEE